MSGMESSQTNANTITETSVTTPTNASSDLSTTPNSTSQDPTNNNIPEKPVSKVKNLAYIVATAAVIPFFICSLGIATNVKQSPFLIKILLGYSAVILSFLCGSHWGMAISQDSKFPKLSRSLIIESILLALATWVILLFVTVTKLQFFAFMGIFGLIWLIDLILSINRMIPFWFLGLRTLTLVLIIGLLTFTQFAMHNLPTVLHH